MHEAALMNDLISKIETVADEEGASKVTRVRVRLGALSHFTPQHFREHFEDASAGTVAEGAKVDAVLSSDLHADDAQDVLLESIEVESPEVV